MRFQRHPTFGFTTKANGIVREFVNEIYVSELHDPSTGLPEPVKKPYKAIWDTGATNTVVTQRVLTELNLQPTGRETCQVVGPANQLVAHDTDTFLVNIYLPNSVTIIGIRVSSLSIGDADVLLGMDVIANGDFAVTNYSGETWWTFRVPSNEPIDFVEEIEEYKKTHGPKVVGGNPQLRQWLERDRRKQGMRKKKRR